MIKIQNLSSTFKLAQDGQFAKGNKVSLVSTKVSITKNDVKNMIAGFTKATIKSVNTLIVKKDKFFKGGSLGKEKYAKINYYQRTIRYKKIIITFNHSRGKAQFLSDFGIE